MNDKAAAIEELIENMENMLRIIEEQESTEPEFSFIRELADQLREEIIVLQE